MDLHRFSAFDYMKLIVGSALVAAAFQFFTFPNSIVSGGVTGIAQIIHLLTRIPVGVLSHQYPDLLSRLAAPARHAPAHSGAVRHGDDLRVHRPACDHRACRDG